MNTSNIENSTILESKSTKNIFDELENEIPPYAFIGKKTISLADWISIPDCPRQRDTESHSVKAKKSHLRHFDPAQAMVTMAITPDGNKYKIDGHTRCLLWKSGELQAPEMILVDVWSCVDIDAVKRLYLRFDAATAAETGADRLRGAAREYGLNFKAPMLRDGHYGTAIKRLYQIGWGQEESRWTQLEYLYEAVKTFQNELLILDEIYPQPVRFTSGIIAASIVTIRKQEKQAIEFWSLYEKDGGKKEGKIVDGVQALTEFLKQTRYEFARKKGNSTGNHLQSRLMYAAFEAFNYWNAKKKFGANRKLIGVTSQEARAYIKSCKNA